ncbi:MAG TPA: fused MFS/spermidine synthase [Candidatus Corynebacterium avicola]|uniref:Fused MFS/spermidine synthase n=1 Tax=Candidatus Corynebacterium avicola TaxID=2838527 RepID=A0A9D1UKF3_9CORY|nr:fused MFS/spermidine synthase [Candidatus Corynebacterium avicola]
MARKARGAQKSQPSAGPVAGSYEGSSGPIELEPDPYLDNGWVIKVNGVPSSHVVIGAPRQLVFEYMQWIAVAVESHLEETGLDPATLRLTHLGGGACSLARYFADLYPTSRNTVVELDGKLAELVRSSFDVPRSPRVKIRVGDARDVAASFVPDSRDVIIRDVFAGDVTPWSLTTTDFFTDCHRGLAPGGLYVANCGDHSDLREAKAELAGMAEVWEHVAVIADPPMLKGRRYGNIILLASDTDLLQDATPAMSTAMRRLLGGAVPAQYKDETWTRKFFSGAAPRQEQT